jgi:hypothetical protein
VPGLKTFTCAPGMAAPELSVIVPWMLPRKVCALEVQARIRAKNTYTTAIVRLLIGPCSSNFLFKRMLRV